LLAVKEMWLDMLEDLHKDNFIDQSKTLRLMQVVMKVFKK